MKYFIGILIPENYKTKIELLRAKNQILMTEPHIKLLPSKALPNNDFFIKKLINICENYNSFDVSFYLPSNYKDKLIYSEVVSKELLLLQEKISLCLNIKKHNYSPKIILLKKNKPKKTHIELRKRKQNIELKKLSFKVNSIIVYYKPKEDFIYLPYMKIPFGKC